MEHGRNLVVPVLLYLFHRVQRRLTGQPTLISLDEAWTYLLDPLFADRIRLWLKELRKYNALVLFSTQSLADIHNSPHRHLLFESCPTKIFLANPEAASEHGAELYRSIGLNPRQIELIASATPKRDYYYASPLGRRLLDLNLGPLALAFVGAGSRDDLRTVRELVAAHGTGWVPHWLRLRGLGPWAEVLDRSPLTPRSLQCVVCPHPDRARAVILSFCCQPCRAAQAQTPAPTSPNGDQRRPGHRGDRPLPADDPRLRRADRALLHARQQYEWSQEPRQPGESALLPALRVVGKPP